MEKSLASKEAKLIEFLRKLPAPALAFSGGVDSALLLAACKKAKIDVQVFTAITPLMPAFEKVDITKLIFELDFMVNFVYPKPLDLPEFCRNDSKRCYYCKKLLFETIKAEAEKLGCQSLLDGTNLDDLGDYRPGMKATKELGVISPLLECGFTKADVRTLAKKYKLSIAKKPAYACLATRIAYGEEVTVEKLSQIEKAEDALKALGLKEVRIRYHKNLARIEVPPQEIVALATELREQIINAVKNAGFDYVTLDLEGFRSGSMNKIINDKIS